MEVKAPQASRADESTAEGQAEALASTVTITVDGGAAETAPAQASTAVPEVRFETPDGTAAPDAGATCAMPPIDVSALRLGDVPPVGDVPMPSFLDPAKAQAEKLEERGEVNRTANRVDVTAAPIGDSGRIDLQPTQDALSTQAACVPASASPADGEGAPAPQRRPIVLPDIGVAAANLTPITELPKWKRGENVRLVKTEEQFAAAAKLFAEGRRAVCAGNWTEEYCASLTEEEFLAQLKAEKKGGWACYLHTTKDVPDGMVSVDHKTGRIEHLFVSGNARGKGIGQKMLDFARKKLEEYEHPRLSVLDTNARAIALYRRMGWKFTGEKDMEFDPAEYPSVVKKCALLWMQYEG